MVTQVAESDNVREHPVRQLTMQCAGYQICTSRMSFAGERDVFVADGGHHELHHQSGPPPLVGFLDAQLAPRVCFPAGLGAFLPPCRFAKDRQALRKGSKLLLCMATCG